MGNCFKIPKYKGSDVSYEGNKNVTFVAIEDCDTIEDVLSKTVSALDNIPSYETAADNLEVDINTQGIGNAKTVCAAALLGYVFDYETSITGTSVRFGYDLVKSTSNLPQGYNLYQILVETRGAKGVINRGTSISSGFNIALDDFPIKADVRLIVSTTCGLVELYKQISISSTAVVGKYTTQFDVNDLTTAAASKKLKDLLSSLYARVAYLENVLQSTRFVTTEDRVTTLEQGASALSSIYLSQDAKFSYDSGTYSLQEVITDIDTRLGSLEGSVLDYGTRLNTIEDQLAIP